MTPQPKPEQLIKLGSVVERINRFSRHVDSCYQCKLGQHCEAGKRLREEMEK